MSTLLTLLLLHLSKLHYSKCNITLFLTFSIKGDFITFCHREEVILRIDEFKHSNYSPVYSEK